jgi:hypothetical protein
MSMAVTRAATHGDNRGDNTRAVSALSLPLPPLHLLIPGAAQAADRASSALSRLPPLPHLPNLRALLARMTAQSVVEADDDSPVDPFEIALARALALPGAPGRVPWAAHETRTFGAACAWLAPAHLEAGMNDVRLSDPAALQLTDEHSRALLAACAPLLADDGVALRYARPDAWLAQGELLDGLACWSPRRAAGRSLMPGQGLRADDLARQAQWLRLASELEMLLYAHPVNEARERAGLATINALWVHGAGRLEAGAASDSTSDPISGAPSAPGVRVVSALAELTEGASAGDGPIAAREAWCEAWRALDAGPLADLLAHVQGGAPARLTLCGPRRARTWATVDGTRGVGSALSAARRWFIKPASVAAELEALCN